jgi:dimethylhistidine N-methyltransferase
MTIILHPLEHMDACAPSLGQFRADVLRGLSSPAKELPCKYFYDEAGSRLFEQITELEEYYPTRTERGIMERHASEMAGLLGSRCLLIEYGSGSSTKTRLLLDHLQCPAGYVPIDVSAKHLLYAARALAADYPHLEVIPLSADFTRPLTLPAPRNPVARRVVYFPGSTIGNLTPEEAIALFRRTASLCGLGGGLLLGADLQKDLRVIEAAYNDRQGVTAAFNRNILVRINRELGADFDIEQFSHLAFYDAVKGRIEVHLVSRRDQTVRVRGVPFSFAADESIHTENSYKYTVPGLTELAGAGGFAVERVWTDERQYFSVCYFTVATVGKAASFAYSWAGKAGSFAYDSAVSCLRESLSSSQGEPPWRVNTCKS